MTTKRKIQNAIDWLNGYIKHIEQDHKGQVHPDVTWSAVWSKDQIRGVICDLETLIPELPDNGEGEMRKEIDRLRNLIEECAQSFEDEGLDDIAAAIREESHRKPDIPDGMKCMVAIESAMKRQTTPEPERCGCWGDRQIKDGRCVRCGKKLAEGEK